MTTVNQNATLIEVHGRSGLNIPYTRYRKIDQGREEQVDISASTMFIEIPAIHLRKALVVNPDDAMGLIIRLTRTEVEGLPIVPCDFAVVDETPIVPDVELSGKIVRSGYIGDPSV